MMYSDGKRKKEKKATKLEKQSQYNKSMFEMTKTIDRLERPDAVPKKQADISPLLKKSVLKYPNGKS
jgi:DNA replication protein DnaD